MCLSFRHAEGGAAMAMGGVSMVGGTTCERGGMCVMVSVGIRMKHAGDQSSTSVEHPE